MIRRDDLQRDGLILYQDTDLPRFTEDSVLLAHFLRLSPRDRVLDAGSGTGVLSVLGTALTGASFTGIEREAVLTALAERSEAENRQGIRYLRADITDAPNLLGHGSFSAAVMNPPYFSAGPESPSAARAAARHVTAPTLGELFASIFLLLKNGGRFFLCCPADRLCDVFCLLRENRLEPKRLQLVTNDVLLSPRLALIEAKKLAKPGLLTEPVHIVPPGAALYAPEAERSFLRDADPSVD